jgi:hypothetical protein
MRPKLVLPTIGVLTMLCGAPVFADPVVVACGSGQRAVVSQGFQGGAPITRVECAGSARSSRSAARYASSDRLRQRSWGKSALNIAGGASTGAGIGGIVRGKKGALLGAALGGGAASLYEGARRR